MNIDKEKLKEIYDNYFPEDKKKDCSFEAFCAMTALISQVKTKEDAMKLAEVIRGKRS